VLDNDSLGPQAHFIGKKRCLLHIKTLLLNLMSVCPCIVDDMKRESQLDAAQWFIELMIRSTCFGHYYAHHQELETIQMFTAYGT
jgi:hypothetical protein